MKELAYNDKHTWVNGQAPYLSAVNLNEMEDGISGAHNLIDTFSLSLVGFVFYYCKQTPPNGWIVCDGRALSRTKYSNLFNVIGITFGSGDGSTTFNIPDLRGEFIRGYDGNRGIDSGRVFGSLQDGTKFTTSRTGARYVSDGDNSENVQMTNDGQSSTVNPTQEAIVTRPRNVALLPCIYTGVLETE